MKKSFQAGKVIVLWIGAVGLALVFVSSANAGVDRMPAVLNCRIVQNLCYLTGSYNDLKGLFLVLDTGSSLSVLDSSREPELKLKPQSCGAAGGPGSDDSNQYCSYSNVSVVLNGIGLENQDIVTVPFDYVAKRVGYPTNGTIGWNLFARYVVQIDYFNGQVTLTEPSSFSAVAPKDSIPIDFESNVPTIQATVELSDGSKISGKFLIDTGQVGSALLFSGPFQAAHPEIFVGKVIHPPPITAVGGKVDYLLRRISRLQFGPYSFQNPIAMLPVNPAGLYSQSHPDIAGGIGVEILSRFTVTFDYIHKQMYLVPNSRLLQIFPYDRSGLQLVVNPPQFHRIVIGGVLEHSPASDADIRTGDIVVSIDGKSTDDLSLSDVQDMLRDDRQRILVIQRAARKFLRNLRPRELL